MKIERSLRMDDSNMNQLGGMRIAPYMQLATALDRKSVV